MFALRSLETLIRRLVLAYAGGSLEILRGTVTGVQPTPDGKSIKSILMRPIEDSANVNPNAPEPTKTLPLKTIPCAFFADCSGAAAISPKILSGAGAGWGPYARHHYDANVTYRTAIFPVPKAVQDKLALCLPANDPHHGHWDKVTTFILVCDDHDTGSEMFGFQRVDGNKGDSVPYIFNTRE
jgi:hypothetical protein